MNNLFWIIGLAITLITIYDMLYTILSPRGAGILSGKFARNIWRLSLRVHGKNGNKSGLRLVGPFLLLFIVLMWIALLWLGNTLIIYSDSNALVSSLEKEPVKGFMENLYFIAYILSSMGSGDYTPNSDWWLFYTGFISYTGVVLISLGISFLIPVIEAITLKREVSMQINNLGENPKQILMRYKDDDYKGIIDVLRNLETTLLKLAQYHLAYPVIHYFHSEYRYESLPIKLTILDETMSILLYKISIYNISEPNVLERTYRSMTYYLSTLTHAYIKPGNDEPEHPDVSYLQQVSEKNAIYGAKDQNDLAIRRKILLAYLQNDGWSWNDVNKNNDAIKLK